MSLMEYEEQELDWEICELNSLIRRIHRGERVTF